MSPKWNKRIRLLLADDLSNLFIFQIIHFQPAINLSNLISQLTQNHDLVSPTTESSGLSILVPTLLLLQ